jgi:hypothetical protein
VRRLGPVPTRKGILNPVASSAEFAGWVLWHLPSGKHTKIYGQSPSLIGKSTIKDLYNKGAIFNSYTSGYWLDL